MTEGQRDEAPLFARSTVTIVPDQEGRLEGALSKFVDRLREAALVYDRDRDENAGRRGCMVALTAAIDFCQNIGLSSEEDRTFFRLLLGLQNAESGVHDKLLARAPPGKKPETNILVMRQRGYVAAAIEALLRDKRSLPEAATWVAGRAKQLKLVAFDGVKEGRLPRDVVKGWRDEAKKRLYKVNWDTTTYRDACQAMEVAGVKGEAAAERLLSDAAEIG